MFHNQSILRSSYPSISPPPPKNLTMAFSPWGSDVTLVREFTTVGCAKLEWSAIVNRTSNGTKYNAFFTSFFFFLLYYYIIIIYLLIYRVLYWQEDVKNVCFSSANIHIFSESAALLDDFLKVEKSFLQGGYVHYPFVIVIVIESHFMPLFICEKWHPNFCLFRYNYSRLTMTRTHHSHRVPSPCLRSEFASGGGEK